MYLEAIFHPILTKLGAHKKKRKNMVLEPNIVPHRDLVRGLCSHRSSNMNGSCCHTWLSHNLAYCPLANTSGWWLPPGEVEGLGVASLAPTLNAHIAIF